MALEETGQAKGEPAPHGKTASRERWLLLGPIVSLTLMAGAILFFGLGFRFSFTQGDSMEPNYHDGSLIIKREVEPTSLKVGDVISFYAPWADSYVMHRVERIHNRGGELWFGTRGDNNPVSDPEEVTFQDENPQRVLLAAPGGLEAAFAIAAVVLGLLAVKAIGGFFCESG
ncbi:MAG TPA: signal peptidase I [Dehalococcoidia bacterium]|nr:signal peptidase I [Dehalococcoidia bacterium]